MIKRKIKTGSDFSGVGAFDQALNRLKIKQDKKFACDMDKFARISYIANYGEPDYFPENVYDREIPKDPLDIYMTSPPCQAFSIAGKRGGENDKRGILFYNSHEFIRINGPRYFIFENVTGLLSHDNGRTFGKWVELLGGKSVNGTPVFFPHEESVPYHIYYFQMNAKEHGVPQNRPRVFVVGIRDDSDNDFRFPKPEQLVKKLRDCVEEKVDKKYFLSQKAIDGYLHHKKKHDSLGNGFGFSPKKLSDDYVNSITTNSGSRSTDNFLLIKSNTKKGYEKLTENDSLNLSVPESKTRRGRVGKEIAQTLDTSCNQGVMVDGSKIRKFTPRECFRFMDFPDSYKIVVSDRQAYKQAGNSIPVRCLVKIIERLNLK